MHLCRYQIYSFTALQVCNYHQQYYRPENLCVIITGQIDPNKVFEAVNPFEEKIISKVSNLFVQVYSISQFCVKQNCYFRFLHVLVESSRPKIIAWVRFFCYFCKFDMLFQSN